MPAPTGRQSKAWLFPCAIYSNSQDAQNLLEKVLQLLEQNDSIKIPTILKELPHDSPNLGFCARPEKTVSLKLR